MNAFTARAVLGDTFRILNRNLLTFGGMVLVMYVVLGGLDWAMIGAFIPTDQWRLDYASARPWLSALSEIIGIFFWLLVEAMVTVGTYEALQGREPGWRACIGRGTAVFPPVVGATVLSVLVVIVFALALVIPGVMAMVALYVVVPVIVIERPRVVDSLRRSRDLTAGHRGEIFGVFIALTIISLVIGGAVQWLASLMGAVAAAVAELLVKSLCVALAMVVPAVIYHRLRQAKESAASLSEGAIAG